MKDITITDALVLPDRKLAWIGLETAQMAERCISFLDQTYALGGTHKISVEYAAAKTKSRKKEEGSGASKKQTRSSPADSQDRASKRKHSTEGEGEVTGKRSKQSFWANDDIQEGDVDKDCGNDNGTATTAVQNNSDLEFLKSKQVAVEDLEDEDDKDDAANQKVPKLVSRRLFVRNLPYSATESQVQDHFSPFATGVKIIVDQLTDQSKGFGFVECATAEQAQSALEALDGWEFQGRVLSVTLAEPPREAPSTTTTPNQFDSQKDRAEGWASSHIRADAVLDAVADALGVGQGEVLSVKGDLSAGDAAVRLALGETAVIRENRNYLASHGYELDDFVQLIQQGRSKQNTDKNQADANKPLKRSNTAILVKNLPFDTTVDELSAVFPNSSSILLTPSHTLAVIHFVDALLAKKAFRRNAYRRFKKSVPLYLEWAPERRRIEKEDTVETTAEVEEEQEDNLTGVTGTLYVKNLNFKTSESKLLEAFEEFGARSVRIPQKTSTTGRQLSMGYGFIEFDSAKQAEKAIGNQQGRIIDDHKLELALKKQSSARNSDTKKSSNSKSSKLMVRNIPFQANRKEILQLFGEFGTLKRVRLPKKFDASQHRGFGFVEYVSHKEAMAAKSALASTHLYGRHLVIEFADDEDGAPVP